MQAKRQTRVNKCPLLPLQKSRRKGTEAGQSFLVSTARPRSQLHQRRNAPPPTSVTLHFSLLTLEDTQENLSLPSLEKQKDIFFGPNEIIHHSSVSCLVHVHPQYCVAWNFTLDKVTGKPPPQKMVVKNCENLPAPLPVQAPAQCLSQSQTRSLFAT